MKRQSLRELATELGVSHSYLSQVIHRRRPASERVAQALAELLSGKQVVSNVSGNGEWARQDLNLRPIGYEPTALTPELRARV
jgi:transcriptional regulator with XRE-family HTH domain